MLRSMIWRYRYGFLFLQSLVTLQTDNPNPKTSKFGVQILDICGGRAITTPSGRLESGNRIPDLGFRALVEVKVKNTRLLTA